MTTAKQSAHRFEQKAGRLNRQIIRFAGRVAEIGEPKTPREKRAMTLAMKCLRRNMRDLDSLKKSMGAIK